MNNVYSGYEATSAGKVVLLYSGGLDTSCLLKWIPEKYGSEIVALTVDLGQPAEFDQIAQKALDLGAAKAIVIDAKQEFAEEYVSKAIKADALYENSYPLSTALGRPLLSKKAVETALNEGADAIAHGCTGKGNDQVRLEAGVLSIAPEMKIIAPIRKWQMNREDEIEYALANGIGISPKSQFSVDENLWGRSVAGGIMEDPSKEPPDDAFEWCALPENAPNSPEYATLTFEDGLPVKLNGNEMPLALLVQELNGIAGRHGIGVIDHLEDRIVGLKTREVYECPAASCILLAHQDLLKSVSTIHQNQFVAGLREKWAFLVYAGLWNDPLKGNLDAFFASLNGNVGGEVKLKLFKGNAQVVGRKSPSMLYDFKLATYGKGGAFNQASSPGFIELWSLQTRMAARLKVEEHGAMEEETGHAKEVA